MSMTPKERMMRCLNREVPDRLPATIHQWQPYHLKHYMDGMDALSAFKAYGFDASISYFTNMGQTQFMLHKESKRFSEEWFDEAEVLDDRPEHTLVKHLVTTPEGRLTYTIEADEKTSWIKEYLIKEPEDIRHLKYLPVPQLDKDDVTRAYEVVGDAGILRGFVWGEQAGCWQQACVFCEIQQLIFAAIDTPEWVHEFLGVLLEKKLQFIEESLRGARFDLIETGGGAGSSTVISPQLFEEFCLPYDRKIHEALHGAGHRSTYHTCGGMKGIFDLIVQTETDASETLSPPGVGGNIKGPEAYEALHGKVALIGGMDQVNILTNGTKQQICDEVRRLFDVFGKGGGYIMSASDHFFTTPRENLEAYAQAAKECVY